MKDFTCVEGEVVSCFDSVLISILFVLLFFWLYNRNSKKGAIMKKSVVFFVVAVFSLLLITPAFALNSNDAKILIKNGYAKGRNNDYYQPTPELMPYFYDVVACPMDPNVFWSSGECKDILLILGKWHKATCTGIRMIDNGTCIAYFTLSVMANEIGKLLGVKKEIPLIVKLTKWDDGWRYEKALWKKMKNQDSWVKNSLNRFSSDLSCINQSLWQMHEFKIYAKEYQKMVKQLEKSDDISDLDTVAWVYKDNGNTAKAVKIYEERILPVARSEGGEELQEYLNYYKRIKE